MPNFTRRGVIPILCVCAWGLWSSGWLRTSSRDPLGQSFRVTASESHGLKEIDNGWVVPVHQGAVILSAEQLRKTRYLVIGSLANAHQRVTVELTPLAESSASNSSAPVLKPLPEGPFHGSSDVSRAVPAQHPHQTPVISRSAGERFFRVPITDRSNGSGGLTSITGKRIASGARSQVLLDSRDSGQEMVSQAHRIVDLMDREVIPLLEQRLGPVRDMDGDGHVSLLLTSHLREMVPQENVGAVPLRGLTWSEDFQPESRFGNHADLIYLNIDLPSGEGLRSLLQHELTHAIFFSAQSQKSSPALHEDWLSEGLAHLAETWNNTDSSNWGVRLQAFNAQTAAYPLLVPGYAQAGLWRNPGCRGATFQFLNWCESRCGETFARRVLQGEGSGVRRLEEAAGLPFADLFRLWSCAGILTPEQLPRERNAAGNSLPHVKQCRLIETERVSLRGSSFQILKLNTDTEIGVRIEGSPNAELQVTLIP